MNKLQIKDTYLTNKIDEWLHCVLTPVSYNLEKNELIMNFHFEDHKNEKCKVNYCNVKSHEATLVGKRLNECDYEISVTAPTRLDARIVISYAIKLESGTRSRGSALDLPYELC